MPNCNEANCPLVTGRARKFCGYCGKRTTETVIPSEIDIVTPPDGLLRFSVVQGEADTLKSTRRISGNGPDHLTSEITNRGWELIADLSMVSANEHLVYELEINDFGACDGKERTIWSPEADVRKQTVTIHRRDPEVKVTINPSVAIFSGFESRAYLDVRNIGNAPVTFGSLPVPYGYQVVDPSLRAGFQLGIRDKKIIEIEQTGYQVQRSNFELSTTDGKVVGTVQLLPVETAKPKSPPEFVVSIDFGTSNTSVYCMKNTTKTIDSITIGATSKERFPTRIYAPENVSEAQWQAIEIIGKSTSEIIYNLKSLLRDPNENHGEKGELNKRRLRFYLNQLLEKGIRAYLEGRNGDDGFPVEFVFTVPVLDGVGNPKHEEYKNLLLSAAKDAGFEDPRNSWSVTSIMEPNAGSLEVLYDPANKLNFGNGDKILVIDAGGGTTDVTLGTLHLRGAIPELIDVKNFSPKCEYGTKEIGGDLFTWLLGEQWFIADKSGNIPADKETQLANRSLKTVNLADEVKRRYNLDGIIAEDVQIGGDFGSENCWTRLPLQLKDIMNDAKLMLSEDLKRLKHEQFRTPPREFILSYMFNGDNQYIPYTLLDYASTDFTKSTVVDQISEFLIENETRITDIKHVFLIGGTSYHFYYSKVVSESFPGRTMPVSPTAGTAVCRGATRIHQAAPPKSPIGLGVKAPSINEPLITSGEMRNRTIKKRFNLVNPGPPVDIKMVCTLPDNQQFDYLTLHAPSGFDGVIVAEVSPDTASLALEKKMSDVERETISRVEVKL